MDASINVNDYVYVVINEHGWKVLREYYEKFFKNYTPPYGIDEYVKLYRKSTEERWVDGEEKQLTKIQLHDFMRIFGSKMYCGAESVIENNRIYLTVN